MLAPALAWLRAKWHAFAVTAGLVLLALVASWSAGRRRERLEADARRARTVGDALRDADELAERDRERARIEADERARLVQRTREQLAHPPRTTAEARAEAKARRQRALDATRRR